MKKIYCDNCGKETSECMTVFGYDVCDSVICDARLTIRAEKERFAYPYNALIPTKKQIKEAQEILNV